MPGLTLSRTHGEAVTLRNATTEDVIKVTVVRTTDGTARITFEAARNWQIFRTEKQAEWTARSEQHDGPLEADGGPPSPGLFDGATKTGETL